MLGHEEGGCVRPTQGARAKHLTIELALEVNVNQRPDPTVENNTPPPVYGYRGCTVSRPERHETDRITTSADLP